jgi:hypothetical protein
MKTFKTMIIHGLQKRGKNYRKVDFDKNIYISKNT